MMTTRVIVVQAPIRATPEPCSEANAVENGPTRAWWACSFFTDHTKQGPGIAVISGILLPLRIK
jgi:hypothetical protein